MSRKEIIKIIHQLIVSLKCEFIFVMLGRRISFFNKFIPIHNFYKEGSIRNVNRDGVNFRLDVSDYMQWYLFINAKDIAPQTAIKYVKENSVVLDIGCNVGHFSLKLAKLLDDRKKQRVNIFTFDPNTWVSKFLRQNLSLNPKLAKKINHHQLAIGSSDGSTEFIFGKRNSGAGRIDQSEFAIEKVKIERLDTFTGEKINPATISFIKIDVEGFEPEVFEGSWGVIKQHRPVLFFEFSPSIYKTRGVKYTHFLNELRALGYSFQMECNYKLVKLPTEESVLDQIFQTNVLAVPVNS